MEINVTAIERNLRLYAVPASISLAGLVAMVLVDPGKQSATGMAALAVPIKQVLFLAAAATTLAGALWFGYRAWLELRWQRGAIRGCDNCGGAMQHFTGRYGDYSKCLMCGVKRKGHR